MRVSLEWLRQLIDVPETVEELVDELDLTGTKVEAVHHLGASLEGVVVGRIEKIEAHPDADTLHVCRVSTGEHVSTIVCGAPNIKEGQTVPLALVGATLPNGVTVRKAKIRGVESEGMLAAEDELGLGEDHTGIMVLDDSLTLGEPLADALDLVDTVLELEVTPNRPDCLSIIGVAREIGAIKQRPYSKPEAVVEETAKKASDLVSVRIDDPELCPRYCARVIEDVKITPSPRWMQERLIASGIRPISNIVDVTNYVMMETGQPLHAFDYDKVVEGSIIVRRARRGEKLETLDGVERTLSENMLLITDPSGPIALAGVMGGANTEVSETTTRILLEGANFNPASVSRTSRTLGLLSEASLRFERGADPNNLYYSLDRAMQLMAETSEGNVLSGIVDEYPKKIEPATLTLRVGRADEVLGIEIEARLVADLLERLELEVLSVNDGVRVRVPTFRPDLEREIDLIEEIARLYGFNEIPSTLPANRQGDRGLSPQQKAERVMRASLEASGLYEAMTYSFVDPRQLEMLRIHVAGEELLRLENPLSAEQSVMRPSLLPGLIGSLISNVNRGMESVALFEAGRVFRATGEKLPLETKRVAFAMTGPSSEPAWYETPPPVDFFDAKGVLETLLRGLNVVEWDLRRAEDPSFHPGRCATVVSDGRGLGMIGELHPEIQHRLDLPAPVALAELDVTSLLAASQPVCPFKELSRQPAVKVDLAIVVDEAVPAGRVRDLIVQAAGALLEEIGLFDVYRGEQVEAGKKSLAFQLTFRAPDRTLTDEEIEKVRKRITSRLAHELGARIRS